MIEAGRTDDSHSTRSIPLQAASFCVATFALKTLIAATVGLMVSFGCYRFVPFRDPLDVVGPALMRGYSEAAEQWALYGYWMATIAAAVFLNRIRRDSRPTTTGLWVGTIAGLLLMTSPFLAESPLLTMVLLGTWTAAYAFGSHASPVIELRFGPLRWPWIGVLFWMAGYHGLFVSLFDEPLEHVSVFIVMASLLGVLQLWQLKTSELVSRRILTMAAVAMLAAAINASSAYWQLSLSAAVVYGLGVFARNQARSVYSRSIWLVFVLCVFGTAYRYRLMMTADARLLSGLGGIGIGAVLHCLMREWTPLVHDWGRLRGVLLRSRSVIWGLLVLGLAIWRPQWTLIGVVLLGLKFGLSRCRWRPWRFWSSTVAGLFLTLVIIPMLPLLPLDNYHDGYNLSCAWAFESGLELYTELMPIRSYQFFVTWLSRRVLPPTIDAYRLTFSVLQVLPPLGAFALSMVWTRGRLVLSVTTAMAVLALSRLDSRQAVHLLLAAVMLKGLHRDRPATWLLMGLGSVAAGACGFDTLCPLAAASTLTLFCVPNSQRTAVCPSLGWRVLRAMQGALLAVVPYSLVIALWQGPRAAVEHWRLLFDYAANFGAFAGLPIMWEEMEVRFQVCLALVMLAVWISGGVSRWPMMSPARRRAWLFLMVQFGLLLHRGTGRSGLSHLQDSLIPIVTLLSLSLFECLRVLRQTGQTPAWLTSSRVAWMSVACLIAVFERPIQFMDGPLLLTKVSSIWQGIDSIPLGEVDYVQQTVAPQETLWAIENTTSNYANRRPFPIRHPLAHTICSPSEQRRVVADLRSHPPRLIEWPTKGIQTVAGPRGSLNQGNFATVCVYLSHDEIAVPLRYYVIFQDLLPRYRPSEQPGYLEPAPPVWRGVDQLPEHLNRAMDCQRLPLVWGERRMPRLASRIKDRMQLPRFSQDESSRAEGNAWELVSQFETARYNRLLLSFAVSGELPDSEFAMATLQFTPDAWDSQATSMTFDCPLDGREHIYLVPVGSCPGWVWRARIKRLKLEAPAQCQISAPVVEALLIDELSP
jgi:hypothetical protein